MVVALFVCRSSPYWSLLGPDACFDLERDARTYAGPSPVVAHPPCRGWGRFKAVAKVRPGELDLAFFALEVVRKWGGVLEHPASSSFWSRAGVVRDGFPDAFGGWAFDVDQARFGHRAEKMTRLYCVGVPRWPKLPPSVAPTRSVERMCRQERERTPYAFAQFLVDLAQHARDPVL